MTGKMNEILTATSDLGRASGLEDAAKVLLAMADHKRRVVGTSELKVAASALEENAAEIRRRAQVVLDDIGSRVRR